jgi:hypothetical protein
MKGLLSRASVRRCEAVVAISESIGLIPRLIHHNSLLLGFSDDGELYITRALGKFDVVAVVGFYLASV